jgi:CrcB protein
MIVLAFLAAVVAGGLAAVVRYSVTRAFGATTFPWAVLVVNLVGSAIGGAVLGLANAGVLSEEWRLVVLGGVAGGLTTFSTLAVGTVELALNGRLLAAAGNMLGSLALGIAAACLGCASVALFV